MKDDALTNEELTWYLGISFWRTTIDVVPHSYSVKLCAFEQSKASDSIITCGPDLLRPKRQTVTVMIGRDGAALHFSEGGSVFHPMIPEVHVVGWPMTLPSRVGLGDYVLFVHADKYFEELQLEDMPSDARGFILRIERV